MYRLLLAALLFACSLVPGNGQVSKTANRNDELSCVRITRIFPQMVDLSKAISYDTTFLYVYCYNNIRVFKYTHPYQHYVDGNLTGEKEVTTYLIKHIDSAFLNAFDSTVHWHNKPQDISASRFVETYTDLRLKDAFDELDTAFISSKENKDSGSLIETYLGRNKKDTGDGMTLIFSYSDSFQDHPFHLSGFMDSLKKRRLSGFAIISHTRFVKKEAFQMNEWLNIYKMEKMEFDDREQVMGYIREYLKK
jgi:hypothetical protein